MQVFPCCLTTALTLLQKRGEGLEECVRGGEVKIEREGGREKVGGGLACVFPRHASSCETMIYAFLRTLGSENVTFNQVHREQSKC